jgi:hypothetical protein
MRVVQQILQGAQMNIQRAIEILESGLITEQEQVELIIILYKIQADEREACAKLCEDLHDCEPEPRPDDCATAIRARGNT